MSQMRRMRQLAMTKDSAKAASTSPEGASSWAMTTLTGLVQSRMKPLITRAALEIHPPVNKTCMWQSFQKGRVANEHHENRNAPHAIKLRDIPRDEERFRDRRVSHDLVLAGVRLKSGTHFYFAVSSCKPRLQFSGFFNATKEFVPLPPQ